MDLGKKKADAGDQLNVLHLGEFRSTGPRRSHSVLVTVGIPKTEFVAVFLEGPGAFGQCVVTCWSSYLFTF